MQSITFFGIDGGNYEKYRKDLIRLYTLSFTEGSYAQYIDSKTIEDTLDKILRVGFGFMTFEKDIIIGAILCLKLKNDPDFPLENHPSLDLDTTLYVTDIMVDPEYRGQGVASSLIKYLFERMESKPYKEVVLRVWDKNTPALSLYSKLGFKMIDEIHQTKLDKKTREPFEMKKIYLSKSTNS